MAFVSHRRRGDDRWLEWKVRIFSVAAVLGLAGIYFEERWMTGTAIVLLAGGMFLRFLPGEQATWDDGDEQELDDDTGDAVVDRDPSEGAAEESDGRT